MPRADSDNVQDSRIKGLIIALGKVGKTHWAAMAAAAGFNVLYMNGDVATPTIKRLPLEAKKRIYLMEVGDTAVNGVRQPTFYNVVSDFVKTPVYRWNDTQGKPRALGDPDDDEMWEIRPGRLDHKMLWVIDSWTSLCESMAVAASAQIGLNLGTATTEQMRPIYQACGTRANELLQLIRLAGCHVIVLAHPDEFQHKTPPEGLTLKECKEHMMVIDWTKWIPKSVTKPHGFSISKYFTDVAWLELSPSGTQRMLDFRPDPDKIIGGHFDKMKNADTEYTFANLVREIGGFVPNLMEPPVIDSWLNITTQAQIKANAAATGAPVKRVLEGSQATTAQQIAGPAGGMAALLKRT